MKRIGIITIHSDIHYGAALQAFALNKVVSDFGKSEIIDYRKIPTNLPKFSFPKMIVYHLAGLKRTTRFRNFLSNEISAKRYNTEDAIMENFKGDYDIIIVGSDQVWNPTHGGLGRLNPVFFAAFASEEKYKKISYASSVGNYVYDEDERILVKKWLENFSSLSTREEFGRKQLEQILSKDIKLVVDPTLLLTKKRWIKIGRPVKINCKYLLVYNVGNSIDIDSEYARKIADQNGWKVVFMSIRIKKDKNIDINIPHCGPAEFVWLFANAEFIVTSSFHGVAFSLNLEKNFVNVYNSKSPQRTEMLLKNVGLEERTVKSVDDLSNLELEIDYELPTNKLDDLRKESLAYLNKAIENC